MNTNFFVGLLIKLPVLFFSITVHEFWHAYAAFLLGDTTARDQKRLSLNPLDHLDPIGTLCMVFGFFGWAKPVPIDPYNTRNPEKTMMLTGLAGPLSNIALAIIFALLLRVLLAVGAVPSAFEAFNDNVPKLTRILCTMLAMGITLNIALALFNLLPLGPLDGHHIWPYFLPHKWKVHFHWLNQYGMYVLLGLIAMPYFLPEVSPLWWLLRWPSHWFSWLVAGPEGQEWVYFWFRSFFYYFGLR